MTRQASSPYGRVLVAVFLVLSAATLLRGGWLVVHQGELPPEALPAAIFLLFWLATAGGARTAGVRRPLPTPVRRASSGR